MKGVITVEVPDEALARRVDEMWKLFAGEGDPKPTPQDYFRERLEEIASDELRIAMFGWPMEIHVEVHGWFPTASVPDPMDAEDAELEEVAQRARETAAAEEEGRPDPWKET